MINNLKSIMAAGLAFVSAAPVPNNSSSSTIDYHSVDREFKNLMALSEEVNYLGNARPSVYRAQFHNRTLNQRQRRKLHRQVPQLLNRKK